MVNLEAAKLSSKEYVIPFCHPGGRALSPDSCRFVGQIIKLLRPRKVLEFGSGFSSIVIANELHRQNAGSLDSIDNSRGWSKLAYEMAAKYGMLDRVTFHVFELGLRIYPGLPCVFYKIPENFYSRGPYDLVVADGPGYEVGRDGVLFEVLARLCVPGYVILDDCNADHMQQTVTMWQARFASSIILTEHRDIGNGIGIIEKVNEYPVPSKMRTTLSIHEWLRTARNLLRVKMLGLNDQ